MNHGLSAKPSRMPRRRVQSRARPRSAVQGRAQPLKAVARLAPRTYCSLPPRALAGKAAGRRLQPRALVRAAHSRLRRSTPLKAARSRLRPLAAVHSHGQAGLPTVCMLCLRTLALNFHQLNSARSRAQPFEAAQRRAQPRNAARIRSKRAQPGMSVCRWRLRAPAFDMRSRARRQQPLNTVRSRSTPFRAAQRRSTPRPATHGVNSRLHPLPGGSGDMLHVVSACCGFCYAKPAEAMPSRAQRLQDTAVFARAESLQLAAPVAGNAQQACSDSAGWRPRNKGGCDMRPARRPPAAGKLLGPAHQTCGTLARLSSQLCRKLAGARLRQLPRAFWSPAAKAAASWPGSALHGCSKLVCVRPLRAHTSSSWFPSKFPSGQLGLCSFELVK